MKHTFLLLLPTVLLAACGSTQSFSSAPASFPAQTTDLKIASPFGAPSVALYPFLKNSSANIEGTSGANIGSFLGPNSVKDIVIAPTNAGVAAIKTKSAPFKLAGTVTFGNFFLAATGNDENKQLDPDDYVVAFQKGQVPDKIFSYVYDNLTNVHYIESEAVTPASTLIKGVDEERENAKVDYVLIAEPALTTALSKQPKASIYSSLQEKYAEKSGGKTIMQASIFVNNSADKTKVQSFLDGVKSGVEAFLAEPSVIDEHLSSMSVEDQKATFTASAENLKAMTKNGNRMGLGYKDAYANKESIASFLGLWNMSIDEEVYYK